MSMREVTSIGDGKHSVCETTAYFLRFPVGILVTAKEASHLLLLPYLPPIGLLAKLFPLGDTIWYRQQNN